MNYDTNSSEEENLPNIMDTPYKKTESSSNKEIKLLSDSNDKDTHYFEFDLEEISPEKLRKLEKFVDEKIIEDVIDLYTLENHKDEIVNMEGFGEKSADK